MIGDDLVVVLQGITLTGECHQSKVKHVLYNIFICNMFINLQMLPNGDKITTS
jgi:hypothetical protein